MKVKDVMHRRMISVREVRLLLGWLFMGFRR